MKNCWTHAVTCLVAREGWLLARFTRRSNAGPSRLLGWLGAPLVVLGVASINFGAWLRTGRWLHVYHADRIAGPYTSYEPDNGGPDLKRPPFHFRGHVVSRDTLR